MSFWAAFDFWRDSMLAVLLAGAMCGALGVYVVLRRVVFVGAALTQISGVGVALAFWLASFAGTEVHEAPIWLDPRWLSLIAALIGAISFSFTRGGRRISSDTVIGLGWVLAGATLLLILSSKRIVQEAHEVDDLLYGSAVLVRPGEVHVLAGVVAAVLAVHALFFKELVFVTFDAEMAQTLGYNVRWWDVLLYGTIGVGLSFAVRTVGMLPAFGFLVIPSSAALLLVDRVSYALPVAVLFAIAGGALGYYVAFSWEWPTGASIVAASALALVPGLIVRAFRKDS
jgi:manganese/iron transport system permease protein